MGLEDVPYKSLRDLGAQPMLIEFIASAWASLPQFACVRAVGPVGQVATAHP
jgi:hypothetical protein